VRINSPGGSVFDGIAIHSALLHHPSTVATYIDGLAASAASVIAMGADAYDPHADRGGVRVMPGGELMIHKASMSTDGNDDDHVKGATFLRRQSENLAAMYAGRAGGEPEEWLALMAAETWYFGHEAVETGLADVVVERKQAPPAELAERMKRGFDLSAYRYSSRRDAPDPILARGQIRRAIREGAEPMLTRGEVVVSAGARGRFGDDLLERLNGGPSDVVTEQRSSASEPGGRSIASVEAMLAAMEAER
jgi:ATP-dependent protease ClpP protease subunit